MHEYEVYLENGLHGFGDEAEPASVLLHGSISGGSGRVRRNRSVGERVKKAFSSGGETGEINGVAYGVDRGDLVETDVDLGGDKPGGVALVARERGKRRAEERRRRNERVRHG